MEGHTHRAKWIMKKAVRYLALKHVQRAGVTGVKASHSNTLSHNLSIQSKYCQHNADRWEKQCAIFFWHTMHRDNVSYSTHASVFFFCQHLTRPFSRCQTKATDCNQHLPSVVFKVIPHCDHSGSCIQSKVYVC